MQRTNNRWVVTVIEWQPRNGKRRQGRQKTRRIDKEFFDGLNWIEMSEKNPSRRIPSNSGFSC